MFFVDKRIVFIQKAVTIAVVNETHLPNAYKLYVENNIDCTSKKPSNPGHIEMIAVISTEETFQEKHLGKPGATGPSLFKYEVVIPFPPINHDIPSSTKLVNIPDDQFENMLHCYKI